MQQHRDSVNAARCQIFCTGDGNECQMPPYSEALLLHIECANYWSKIWQSVLEPFVNCHSPHGNDGKINREWLHSKSAAVNARKADAKDHDAATIQRD
jgi:hypothetical protein